MTTPEQKAEAAELVLNYLTNNFFNDISNRLVESIEGEGWDNMIKELEDDDQDTTILKTLKDSIRVGLSEYPFEVLVP